MKTEKNSVNLFRKSFILVIILNMICSLGFSQTHLDLQKKSSELNTKGTRLALPPTISSFSPAAGTPGTSVTISGSNFGSNTSENIVYIGGVKANITSANSTSITFTVPNSVRSEFIHIINTSLSLQGHSSKRFIIQSSPAATVSTAMFGSTTPAYESSALGVDGGEDLLFSDFDGDGKTDVISFPKTNKMVVYMNTSTGSNNYNFSKSEVTYGLSYFDENHGKVIDIDNDGDMDVVLYASAQDYTNPNILYLFTNNSTSGNMSFSVSTLMTTNYDYEACIDVADFNMDGYMDLAFPSSYGSIQIYINDQAGSFGTYSDFDADLDLPNWGRVQTCRVADINEDGKPDILFAGEFHNGTNWVSQICYSENTTTGTTLSMGAVQNLSTTLDRYTNSIEVIDMNADNLPDIVYFAGDYLYGWKNTNTASGTASFASTQTILTYSSWLGSFNGGISVVDINSDGKPEPFGTSWYLVTATNTSSASTISLSSSVAPAAPNAYSSSVIDIDGDGDFENLSPDRTDGALRVFAPAPAEIDIKISSTSYATGSTYNFGTYTAGSSSSSTAFYIYNTGDLDLILSGTPKVDISGDHASDFAIDQTGLASPISGGSNDNFSIVFTPSGAGTRTALISIANSDSDENPYVINLSGTGTITSASWQGTISSDWTNSSNWSGNTVPNAGFDVTIPAAATHQPAINADDIGYCNDITIESEANLTINARGSISISGNLTNNGTFNINSSASGEGSLLVSGSLSGTGTYNVQRYLSGSQWHLVTSPITAGTAGVFEDIWLRPYDESTNAFGDYITPTATPLPTGQGFSVWADANETRTFTGTINHGSTGALSLQLTGAAGPNTGWNLMGNPYPSSIDWDAASGWSRTYMADAVYVWNSSQYATYVGGIGANGGSRYIAPGQGFFLQATNVGSSVTMDNGIRLHNSVSFLKNTQSDPESSIRISVSADGYQDENVIVIREADAFAYDPLVDAYKLPGSADAPQMHIEKDDFSELSIASFPHIQDIEDKVLNIDYALEGTHTLLWSHTCTENTPALLDQQTGQIIEPGSNYTFTASFSDMEDRFVFATDLLSIQDKINTLDMWEYNNTVFVKSNTNDSQISVINMQGVEVYSNTGNTFNLNHLSPAMYVVKVKSGEQTRIEKIVIK